MNNQMKDVMDKMTNIIESGISTEGYPIFALEREELLNVGGMNRLMNCFPDDFIFYSTDDKITKKLRKKLDDFEEQGYVNDDVLRRFIYKHQEFMLDNRVHPLQKLSDGAGDAYVNLTTKYQETLNDCEYGVCHLITEDSIMIFRCWNKDVDHSTLYAIYENPITTQEQVQKCYAIVKDLYEKGEIEPEEVITGSAAKKAGAYIMNENKKLPSAYQQDLVEVLIEFASLENYDINTKSSNKNTTVILHTEKFGDVAIQIPRNSEENIRVKYDDVSQTVNSVKDILMQFHVDRTKEKVNKLSQKIKM